MKLRAGFSQVVLRARAECANNRRAHVQAGNLPSGQASTCQREGVVDDGLCVHVSQAATNLVDLVGVFDEDGTLRGQVDFISADTFRDDRARGPDAEPHYKVTLRVDMTALSPRQSRIAIRPGMMAEVELHTGRKTVLQYLLKPLYKSREAFREP